MADDELHAHPLERESARLLREAYAKANSNSPLVRAVMGPHNDAILALRRTAEALWALGELRWAAAYESRVTDLECQARRHIEAIVQREEPSK